MTPLKGGLNFFLGCKLIICSKPLICSCHYIPYLLLILDVPFISCPYFLALCCPLPSVHLFNNCSFFHSLFPSVFHSFPTIFPLIFLLHGAASSSSFHQRGTLFSLISAKEDPFFYSSPYVPLPQTTPPFKPQTLVFTQVKIKAKYFLGPAHKTQKILFHRCAVLLGTI